MELTFNSLRKKDVISVSDGKNLGRVFDVAFLFPENKIKGFFVTGCKGFKFTKQEIFIPVGNVIKIGEDVILTNVNEKKPPEKGPAPCPPPCPPCPPQCPPPCPPPKGGFGGDGRRNYDEYE